MSYLNKVKPNPFKPRAVETEFGEFVFSNDLTTFEALSTLDVTHLSGEVSRVDRDLMQTRSELSDLSVLVDDVVVRVNTQGFRISDLETDMDTLKTTVAAQSTALGQLEVIVNDFATILQDINSRVATVQTTVDDLSLLVSEAQTAAEAAQTTASAAQITANRANTFAEIAVTTLSNTPIVAVTGYRILCYQVDVSWFDVRIDGDVGTPILSNTNYSGVLRIQTVAGAEGPPVTSTTIMFRSISTHVEFTPRHIRSGQWTLLFNGNQSDVIVQDIMLI